MNIASAIGLLPHHESCLGGTTWGTGVAGGALTPWGGTHLLRTRQGQRPGQVLLGELSLAVPPAALQGRQPQGPGICVGTRQSSHGSVSCPGRALPTPHPAAGCGVKGPKPHLGEMWPTVEEQAVSPRVPIMVLRTPAVLNRTPTPKPGGTLTASVGTFLFASFLKAQRHKETLPLFRACHQFV